MNKFTKVVLILAALFLGVGLACTAAAFVMGASLDTLRDVTVYLDDIGDLGVRHIQEDGFRIRLDQSGDDILPEIDLDLSDDSEEPATGRESSEMSSFEDIKDISLETGAAVIEILYADVERAEVHYDNAIGMNIDYDEGELEIECGLSTSGTVEILIPKGMQLHEIDLDIGAGQVVLTDIDFRSLDADIGAGELIVKAPDAQSAYNYNVDCALGEVVIGDETFSGISSTEKSQGAKKYFDLDCGAGRVEIQFAQ